MEADRSGFKLSTGKELYANFLLLCPTEDGMELYQGYDGWVDRASSFTLEERKEIAAYMIARWTKFAGEK